MSRRSILGTAAVAAALMLLLGSARAAHGCWTCGQQDAFAVSSEDAMTSGIYCFYGETGSGSCHNYQLLIKGEVTYFCDLSEECSNLASAPGDYINADGTIAASLASGEQEESQGFAAAGVVLEESETTDGTSIVRRGCRGIILDRAMDAITAQSGRERAASITL